MTPHSSVTRDYWAQLHSGIVTAFPATRLGTYWARLQRDGMSTTEHKMATFSLTTKGSLCARLDQSTLRVCCFYSQTC